MRLNEVTLHSWDARVGIDAGATADEAAAVLLLELLAGELGFMLGFTAKAEALAEPATVVIGDHLLVVDGSVRLRAAAGTAPTATFMGPAEAALRLLAGRLDPAYTPEGVEVTGNVTLADLRRVFPGY